MFCFIFVFSLFLKKLNKVLIISQYTSNEFSCKAAVTEAEPSGSKASQLKGPPSPCPWCPELTLCSLSFWKELAVMKQGWH